MATEFNVYQQAVAKNYAMGEFSHCESVEEAETVGDTLFLFLMRELSDVENAEEAAGRMETAMADVSCAHSAIDALVSNGA